MPCNCAKKKSQSFTVSNHTDTQKEKENGKSVYPARDIPRRALLELSAYNQLPKLRITFVPGRTLTFGLLTFPDDETKKKLLFLTSGYKICTVGYSEYYTNRHYKEAYMTDLPRHLMDKDDFAKTSCGFHVRLCHFENVKHLPDYVPYTWTDHNCYIPPGSTTSCAVMRRATFEDFCPNEGLTGRQEKDLQTNLYKISK
jgi:hypothetical protein